jgi:hypothetical protein
MDQEKMFEYELGEYVKDNVTNFEGKITARVQYIDHNVPYYLVSAQAEDGKPGKEKWFSQIRLSEMTLF